MITFKSFLFEAQDGDEWLKRYTVDAIDKYPSKAALKDLLTKYPFQGGVLYRGLNFHDKEQYDDFLANTKNGTVLETGDISSWSPVRAESVSFAITRPTYFLNRELMQAEDKKNKDIDYMIGHAGVILKITVGPNVGIDVNKSDYGKEQEVILIPGTYKISVDETMLPFMKSISKDNFKSQFMSISSLGSSANKLDIKKFEHILFHYSEFDDEMKKHLFDLISPNISQIKFAVDVRDSDVFGEQEGKEVIIKWSLWGATLAYFDMLLPEHQKKIRAAVEEVVEKIDKEVQNKIGSLDHSSMNIHYRIDHGLQSTLRKMRIDAPFMSQIYQKSGDRYRSLNSKRSLKNINSLSGDARAKAMKDYTDGILASLSAFN